MANVNTIRSNRTVRMLGALAVGAAISFMASYVRKKVLKAMNLHNEDKHLDRDLAASMDCSDPVARY